MMKLEKFRTSKEGFTLVEIAIVMVIIGLLIGGVLKGQAMIQNAKVKRVVKQTDELRAMIMAFYDKFGVYPGDENKANVPTGDTFNGDGDGLMENNNERFDLFNDLAEADLISGNFTGANVANHVFGGNVQVIWVNPPGPPGADHFIRFDNLPWDVCLEIDTKFDDGVFNTGSIVANEDYLEAGTPVTNFYMPF